MAKEIPYPDDLLMNWVQLLAPRTLSGSEFKYGDFHVDGMKWAIQRLPEYDILVARAQTFPLKTKSANDNALGIGGIMTNRQSHSQLVADVAEMIGNNVGAKITRRIRETTNCREVIGSIGTRHFSSILKLAALSHDLGSPPFAHPGEYAVREWATDPVKSQFLSKRIPRGFLQDIQNFDANANALGILLKQGNVTLPVMASIVKYPNGSGDDSEDCYKPPKYGYLAKDRKQYFEVAEELGLIQYKQGKQVLCRHPLVYLLEAADDIAYLIHDLRDGLKSGHYSFAMEAHPENLSGSREEIANCRSVEQLFYYITGHYFDDAEFKQVMQEETRVQARLSTIEVEVLQICTEAVSRAFLDNENAILNGEKVASLIDLAVLPNGRALGPIYNALRENFFSNVVASLDSQRGAQKESIKDILDLFIYTYEVYREHDRYQSSSAHAQSKEAAQPALDFLRIIKGFDNQGMAQFNFRGEYRDYVNDIFTWLCMQSDRDIIRMHESIKARPSCASFLESRDKFFAPNPPVPSGGRLGFP